MRSGFVRTPGGESVIVYYMPLVEERKQRTHDSLGFNVCFKCQATSTLVFKIGWMETVSDQVVAGTFINHSLSHDTVRRIRQLGFVMYVWTRDFTNSISLTSPPSLTFAMTPFEVRINAPPEAF